MITTPSSTAALDSASLLVYPLDMASAKDYRAFQYWLKRESAIPRCRELLSYAPRQNVAVEARQARRNCPEIDDYWSVYTEAQQAVQDAHLLHKVPHAVACDERKVAQFLDAFAKPAPSEIQNTPQPRSPIGFRSNRVDSKKPRPVKYYSGFGAKGFCAAQADYLANPRFTMQQCTAYFGQNAPCPRDAYFVQTKLGVGRPEETKREVAGKMNIINCFGRRDRAESLICPYLVDAEKRARKLSQDLAVIETPMTGASLVPDRILWLQKIDARQDQTWEKTTSIPPCCPWLQVQAH